MSPQITTSSVKKNLVPLAFIHGSFANGKSWNKIIDKLKFDYQCIAINLPGHGGLYDPTDFACPTFEPEFEKIEKAVFEIPHTSNRVHLVGHSFGGVVALAAALNNKLPIKKLTLFEPVAVNLLQLFSETKALKTVLDFIDLYETEYKMGQKNVCARVIDFWGGKGSFDLIPDHIKKVMVNLTANNQRHWKLCMKSVGGICDYKNLNIPVTLIHGSNSNHVAKSIVRSLNTHLPKSSIKIIDDASHFMITSHPQECVDIIRE